MPALVAQMIQVHIAIPGPQPGEWQFLFLKRAPQEPLYPGIWQVVTGGIEHGETALEAARREVQEETGIAPETLWVLPYVGTFFDAVRDEVHLVPAFGCVVAARDVRLSAEHCDCNWFGLEEALALAVMPSHREGTRVLYQSVLQNLPGTVFPSFPA